MILVKSSWVIWGQIYFDVASINVPRVYAGHQKLGRRVLVFGGLTQRSSNVIKGYKNLRASNYLKVTETVELYDFIENTWKMLPPMPQPRYKMKTTVLNQKVYLFGGFDSNNNPVEEIWYFDLNHFKWVIDLQ